MDAVGTDSLHGDSSAIFGACELERFWLYPKLSGEPGYGFHGVFVLFVKREVQVIPSKFVPTRLSPLRLALVTVVRSSAMPSRSSGASGDEHSASFVSS